MILRRVKLILSRTFKTQNTDISLSNNLRLNEGAHILYVYSDENIYINNAVSFISTGLNSGDGIVFIDTKEAIKVVLEKLRDQGFGKKLQENIVILDNEEFYHQLNEKTANSLNKLIKPIIEKPIRTWGKVVWNDLNKLTNYEFEVDKLVRTERTVSVCAYNGYILPSNFQLELMKSHQYIMTDKDLLTSNLYTKGKITPSIQIEEDLEQTVLQLKRKNKQFAEKLHRSNERFMKYFYNSPDIMIISDKDTGKYIEVNKAFLQTFGYSREEVIGRNLDDLIYLPGIRQKLLDIINSNGKIENEELTFRNKDGETIILLVSAEFIEIDENEYLFCSSKNITEIRRLKEEMTKLDKLHLLGEMAAAVAHEVRNPLTTVRGFIQLEHIESIEKAKRNRYNLMIEELDKANSIITLFLSLSKNNIEKIERKNLNDVIKSITPILESDILKDGKNLKLNLGDIPNISMNYKEIRQVILNLCRNGIEAMKDKAFLTISTYKKNDNVVLAVADQGKGIPPELIDKLGEPFLTTKTSGTGLGLPVVYNIVEKHKAAIEVQTSVKGTTFFIKFPISIENNDQKRLSDTNIQ